MARNFLPVACALIGVGCWPRSHPRDVGAWPTETPPGLVMIETRPGHPGCTGTIFHNAPGAAHVVTAQHCVTDSSAEKRVSPIAVLRPEGRAEGPIWRRYPVTRVFTSRAPSDCATTEKGEVQWISDWAILEIPTPTKLTVLPLLELEGSPMMGDRVSLESFFDVDFEVPRAHAHDFVWGRFSRELVQRGHSGAPVVWNGQLVAVFSGATAYFSWFHLSRQPDKLTLVPVETIRREATMSGFSFDDTEANRSGRGP